MVDTSDAWITERTGIKERHILKGEGLGTSHMGAEAVRGLLQKTGTEPEDVDLLICATTTPDLQFPSTANLICDMVGIRNIGSFDVQAACSGFLYALTIADAVHCRRHLRARSSWSAPTRCRRSSITPTAPPACCSATAPARCCSSRARRLRHHGYADPLRRLRHAVHLHQKAGGSRMPPTAETVAKRLHYVHQEGAAVYKFAIAKHGGGRARDHGAQQSARRHDRLAGAAPGQQAHHRDRRPSAWACRWTR